MSHAGPSTFVCAKCGKGFRRRPDYNRHALIHDPDAERFHCSFPGCTHSSLQKSNLKTHYISKHLHLHHHQCNFYGCTKSYSDASALIRHEKLTHGFFRRAHKPYARTSTKKDKVELELDPELLAFVTDTSPLPNYPSTDVTSLASSTFPTTPSSFMMPIPGPPTFDWGNVHEPQALSMDAFLHEMIPELYSDPALNGKHNSTYAVPEANAHLLHTDLLTSSSFPQDNIPIPSSTGVMIPNVSQLY
ncbi:hypothetical protein ACEPAF_1902 [Sanghuangporus sanghuang]